MLLATGSEKLAARLGLASALGERSLAGIGGSVVFALVLLPTLAAALQALGLDAVTRPVSQLLDSVIALVPRLASVAIILGVAALIGRALAGMVSRLLAGMVSRLLAAAGINRLPARLGLKADFRPAGRDMGELAGPVVMTAVMFVALAQACELLGFAMLTNAVAALGVVMAQLLVAALLMVVGLWLATGAAAWCRPAAWRMPPRWASWRAQRCCSLPARWRCARPACRPRSWRWPLARWLVRWRWAWQGQRQWAWAASRWPAG